MSMFESLESRRLLAGNVTAADNGTLVSILGDNKSNQVALSLNAAMTGYVVTGLNGTTVNGAAFAFLNTSGLARNIAVSLGNGDDVFRWEDVPSQFNGVNLDISMGN